MEGLVTKLKDIVVDNNNFPSTGGLKVIVNTNSSTDAIYFSLAEGGAVTSKSGFYSLGGNLTYSMSCGALASYGIKFIPGVETDLVFPPTLKSFTVYNEMFTGNIRFPFLGTLPELQSFKVKEVDAILDIDTLTAPKLKDIALNGSVNITGNIELFKDNNKIVSINIGNTSVGGSIKNINPDAMQIYAGGCPNIFGDINDLTCYNVTEIHGWETKLFGEIEPFLNRCVSNGRTSGTLRVYNNGIITYKNMVFSTLNVTFNEGGYTTNYDTN